jgi:uncharacterized membrane protein YoaK (UPF0700 family)
MPAQTRSAPAPASRSRYAAANSLATAMVLSVSAGYLDGFTYIGHGHTFASAMTGNMVLLGVNLALSGVGALAYLYPLLAFVFGVIVANVLGREKIRRHLSISPHLVTLIIEIIVLTGVAFLAAGVDDHILVAIVTVSTAMQNTSFRNIGTRTYNSIIMTGNLQTFSNSLATGVWPGDRAAREQVRDLGAVLVSFVVGAALGTLATPRFGDRATLAPAALLFVVALALTFSADARRQA